MNIKAMGQSQDQAWMIANFVMLSLVTAMVMLMSVR